MQATEQRLRLVAAGFTPVPLYGKEPPVYGKNNHRKGLKGWKDLRNITLEQLEMWEKIWPDAINTGILTHDTPAIDIDICDHDAADEIEWLARERFEGRIIVRVGRAPRRAILLRTDEKKFGKIKLEFDQPRDPEDPKKKQAIEVLTDKIVAFGIHPGTKQPYRWFDGQPGEVKREELPCTTQADIIAFLKEAEGILAAHGYTEPKRPGTNGTNCNSGPYLGGVDAVRSALQALPNNDDHYDDWIRIGLSVWAATEGSSEGLAAWDEWSEKSGKYDSAITAEAWNSFNKSPPHKVTGGTLFGQAKSLAGWVPPPLSEEERKPWSACGYFIKRCAPRRAWRIFKLWCERRAKPPIPEERAWQIFQTIIEKDLAQ